MMQRKKDRQVYLDSASGLLVVYMIVYHCAQWAGIGEWFILHTSLLSFFMPWFFFKAGMFYRPVAFAENVRRSARRLLVPWAVWGVVGTMVYFMIMYITEGAVTAPGVLRYVKSLALRGTTQGNVSLWFLFSLFVVRLLYGALYPLRRRWLCIAVVCAVAFVMHYVVSRVLSEQQMINVPYYIANVSSGLMFYALGHRLRSWRMSSALLVLLSAAFVAGSLLLPSYVYMYENTVLCGYYILSMVYSLVGILCINAWTLRYADRKNLFSVIGADTMPYYCMHWIVIEIVAAICASAQPLLKFAILVVVTAVALPILTWAVRRTNIRYIFG